MSHALFNKEDFSQLARFKLLMRQVHHYTVDLSDLAADREYAKQTLDLAEDTDHEELMLLAIELRSRLGLLTPATAAPSTPTPAPTMPTPAAPIQPTADPEPPKNERYRFSLR